MTQIDWQAVYKIYRQTYDTGRPPPPAVLAACTDPPVVAEEAVQLALRDRQFQMPPRVPTAVEIFLRPYVPHGASPLQKASPREQSALEKLVDATLADFDEEAHYDGSRALTEQNVSIVAEDPTPAGRLIDYRDLVDEFHQQFSHPRPSSPTLAEARVELRIALIQEELNEFAEAARAGDMVEIADALQDLKYVVFGADVEYGLDPWPIFLEVHRSNMAKVGGGTRADGKTMKPAGWTPPRIREELEKQGWLEDLDWKSADTERTVSEVFAEPAPYTDDEVTEAAELRALFQEEFGWGEQLITEVLTRPSHVLDSFARQARTRRLERLQEASGTDPTVAEPATDPDTLQTIRAEFQRTQNVMKVSLPELLRLAEGYLSYAGFQLSLHDWSACRAALLSCAARCLSALDTLDREHPAAKDNNQGAEDASRRLRESLSAIERWRSGGKEEPYIVIEKVRRILGGE